MFFTLLHNIPFVIAGLITGIIARIYTPIDVPWYWLASLTPLIYVIWQNKRQYFTRMLIVLGASMIGFFVFNHYESELQRQSQFYVTNTLDVIATINDIDKTGLRQKLSLHVHKTRFHRQQPWQPADDLILLYQTTMGTLDVGDVVQIDSLMCINNTPLLCKQPLVATSFFARTIKLLRRPHISIANFIHHQRLTIWQSLQEKLSPETFHLFSTIFLGKSMYDSCQNELRADFVQWGVAHYLARSGIHLIMIFFLFELLARMLCLPITLRALLMIFLCTAYSALSWSSLPFTRALLAIVAYQICTLFRLPINTLHILNITLLWCLVFSPQLLFFLDFQLTFGLTYGLIFLARLK